MECAVSILQSSSAIVEPWPVPQVNVSKLLQVEAAKRAKDWTLGTASFDEVLARLNSEASTAKPASCDLKEQLTVERKLKKRKKKAKTELVGKQMTEPSARDSMHAGALGPMGMEVDQDMSKSVSAALHASGGVGLCAAITAAARDSPDHSSEAVGGVPAVPASGASHLARFARRRAGKDVRSYSSQVGSPYNGGPLPRCTPCWCRETPKAGFVCT